MWNRTPLRPLSDEEKLRLEAILHSPATPLRYVEQAQFILMVAEGYRFTEIAQRFGITTETVKQRLRRFNQFGLKSFDRLPGSGRPPTYSEVQRQQIVSTAKTPPEQLGLPFKRWTLASLTRYLNQTLAIPISKMWLRELLKREGVQLHQVIQAD
jgi:transposase